MEDWGVVEGVSYLYVVKGHLVSGQVKEKVGRQFGTVLGGGRSKGIMGLPYMASNGLILKGCFLFFCKAQTFKRAKRRSLVQSR